MSDRPEPIGTLDRALASFIAERDLAAQLVRDLRADHADVLYGLQDLESKHSKAVRNVFQTEEAIRNLGYSLPRAES